MPLIYDPKALTESLELGYVHRPRPLARWLRRFTWTAGAVALAVTAWMVWPANNEMLQAGPVATSHAMFNQDCGKCHTVAFATATRLVPGIHGMLSTPDDACLQCHPGPDHNKSVTAAHCADCHREHRGDKMLARPRDQHCTECHSHIQEKAKELQAALTDSGLRDVPSFVDHPEFALWSGPKKPSDPGNVEFNHQLHLGLRVDADGQLAPIAQQAALRSLVDALPVAANRSPIAAEVRQLQEMQCAYCHQPETVGSGHWANGSGRYMQSIQFDRHCQQCHPLLLPLKTGKVPDDLKPALLAFLKEPVSHPQKGQTAWHVRALARERYLKFAQANAAVLKLPMELPEDWLVLPGLGRRQPASQKQIDWVNERWNEAEALLFDKSAGCAHCHADVLKKQLSPDGLPQFATPTIPSRWFEHSVFDHHSHQALQCAACHEGAATSKSRSDVLMPKLANCKECHQATSGMARADCLECHQFHHRADAPLWQGTLAVKQLRGTP